jgi:LAO/AO transport system kinase
MEIADLFVINKSDRPGANKTESELRALVSFSSRPDGWEPAIVRTIASEGIGIKESLEVIEKYKIFLSNSEIQRKTAIQKHRNRILELVCLKAQEDILQNSNTQRLIQKLAILISDRKLDPYTAAEEMWNSVSEKHGSDRQ